MIPYKGKQPYHGGIADYARESRNRCIHNATPLDCKVCNRYLTSSEEKRINECMDKIDLLEALITRLRTAAMTTKDRHARDRIIQKAHEFLTEQQDLIAQSIVT